MKTFEEIAVSEPLRRPEQVKQQLSDCPCSRG